MLNIIKCTPNNFHFFSLQFTECFIKSLYESVSFGEAKCWVSVLGCFVSSVFFSSSLWLIKEHLPWLWPKVLRFFGCHLRFLSGHLATSLVDFWSNFGWLITPVKMITIWIIIIIITNRICAALFAIRNIECDYDFENS